MHMNGVRKQLVALALGCCAAVPAHALVLSATNSNEVVVDAASATRTVSIGAGIITGVTVTLDFMKCDDPLTTPLPAACPTPAPFPDEGDAYAREIIFRLTSPLGTEIGLVEPDTYFLGSFGEGPNPGGRIIVTFDDSAGALVGFGGFVTETAAPVEPLTTLLGEQALGVWTLYIEDDTGADPLGLARFTLDITADPSVTVPEPATLGLLGLGLAGLGVIRRRRAA